MSAQNRILLGLLGLLALLVAYWFLLLSPQRERAAELDSALATERSAVTTARAEIARGRRAEQDFPRIYAELVELGKAVPADDDVKSLVVQLDATAGRTQVDFREIKATGGSGAGGPAAPSPTAPPPAQVPGPGAATAAVTPTQTATASVPPGTVVGSAGLNTYPFTFTFRGSFFRLADFFAEVEGAVQAEGDRLSIAGRLLNIDGLTLEPAPGGWPQVDASVTATGFLVPASEGLTGGASVTPPAQTPVVSP